MSVELLNVDCMEYMRGQPDGAFDLAVVDPPYGIARLSVDENLDPDSKYRRSMARMVESAKKWNGNKPDEEYWRELFRITKNQIVWGANNFQLPPTEYFCIWNKQQTVPNFATAEYAWVSMGLKKPAKVFTYSIHQHNADGGKIHPTQKPVKLYEWIFRNYAKPGQRVLDTHLGSGSIAIAAHYYGVDLVGCEIDEDYYRATVARFDEATRQLALFG